MRPSSWAANSCRRTNTLNAARVKARRISKGAQTQWPTFLKCSTTEEHERQQEEYGRQRKEYDEYHERGARDGKPLREAAYFRVAVLRIGRASAQEPVLLDSGD